MDTIEKDYSPTFSWSVTRDKVFKRCLRAYYYEYYGHSNWWIDQNRPQAYWVNVMKHLNTIPTWIGQIVHEMIPVIINNLLLSREIARSKEKEQKSHFTWKDAYKILERKMYLDWINSRDMLIVEEPKTFMGLVDHFYGIPVDHEIIEHALSDVKTQLEWIFCHPLITVINGASRLSILEQEKLGSFQQEGFPVWSKIDLILEDKTNGQWMIIDWKTGKADDTGNIDRQLGVYAIYVKEKYQIPLERVRAVEINLARRTEADHPLTVDHIEETREYISKSIWQMQGFLDDPVENRAKISNFPNKYEPDSKECRRCEYRGACYQYLYPYAKEWNYPNQSLPYDEYTNIGLRRPT